MSKTEQTEGQTGEHGAGVPAIDPAVSGQGSRRRANNKASVGAYRAKNRRIDYVPSAAALAVINTWRAKGLNNCLAGVIDMLVLEGHRVMSGNSAALGVSKAAK